MKPHDHEHLPGEPASRAGQYEELNVFGTQTGRVTRTQQGDRLPAAPRGFTWGYVPDTADPSIR